MTTRPRKRSLRIVATIAAAAVLAPVAACAQEPVAGWVPPSAPAVPGVALVAPGSDATGGAVDPAAALDAGELGLVGGRLRNDALPFAARFVYLPGVPAFDERVNALLRAEIEATGKGYAPQVHPVTAKLADRGCVPGSSSWPAADVLSRAETAPNGGAGTAVTCELTAAFGTTVAVALRAVRGGPDGVTRDETHLLIADVKRGTVSELKERWSADAPAELWTRAVELLRREAGGLSSAPLSVPDEEQLALALQALDSAVHADGGGVEATMPPGLAAPELAGLGIVASGRPLALSVDAATVREWSSEQQRALLDGQGGAAAPFAGVSAPATSVAIDCALIPCVALTYDDGPSAFTPELLDILKRERASATFFMLGGAARAAPDTVRRVADEGHEIGSHTMTHPDLTMLSSKRARAEVREAADVLRDLSGAPVASFRPPFGAVNDRVIRAAGLPAILWSVDTNDWQDPGPAALFERAVEWPAPGGIVLFHDTHAATVNAAADIVTGLRNRGFEPVTVTELFGGSLPGGRLSGR